jgi:hypothetical protein
LEEIMRFAFALLALTLISLPAAAGTVNFTDGKGTWQSTQCRKPEGSGSVVAGSEDAADGINAQVARQREMVAQLHAYQQCLSDEATRDAAAASQLIVGVASEQMKTVQSDMQLRVQQPAAKAE